MCGRPSPSAERLALPEHLDSELNLPGRRGRAGNCSRRTGNPRRCEHDKVGRIEIGSVQQIEDLGAKLKVSSRSRMAVSFTQKNPRWRVLVRSGYSCRDCRRIRCWPGVEETRWGCTTETDCRVVAVEVRVDKRSHRITGVPIVGRVVAELRRIREPRLQR